MNHKKAICALLGLLLLFSGCARAPEDTVSMYDLSRAMLTAMHTQESMRYVSAADNGAEEKFARVSDLDYGKTDDFFLLYAENGAGNADEIAVISVKNKNDAAAAETSLREHIKHRVSLYETYDPTQVPKLNNALIFTEGRCAVLIVCDDPAAVKAAFDGFLQGENE